MLEVIRKCSIKVKLIVTIVVFLFFSSTALGTISFNYAVGNFSKILHGHAVGLFNQTLHTNANHLLAVMLLTILGEMVIGGMGAYWISIQITKPILQILSRVEQVSTGDLTGKLLVVKQRDEIGRLATGFNQMFVSLRTLIGNALRASQHLAASSEQLSKSAHESSKAAELVTFTISELVTDIENEAQSVDRSTQAVLQISNEMALILENGKKVSLSAFDASEKAVAGTNFVTIASQQMNAINEMVTQLSAIADALEHRSKEIGHIVEIITDIAAQTNLLSLNAAIEAAHAGENGRGFTVVSNEVRKLADQSTESAKQIEILIRQIQDETGNIADFVSGLKSQMSRGLSAMTDAGDSFKQIKLAIETVSAQIQEVSTAVQNVTADTMQLKETFIQVAEVTEQTTTAMRDISSASEEQLASMQEIAASAATMTNMAEQLENDIGKFNL